MERSIAEELYSEISNVPSTELDPHSTTDNAIHNSHANRATKHLLKRRSLNKIVCADVEGDDLWSDDEDMERQWQRRHKQFHTIGYREGLMTGKEASAQKGFKVGFQDSVFVGQTWGIVRGVTSALACLPDALKEKLVETDDKRNRLQRLHESVRDISTTDSLKLFYERLNNGISGQRENVETGSCTGDLRCHFSDGDVLENHVQEFKMFALECPALKVHLHDDYCRTSS